MDWTPFVNLVQSGGAVLIALVVLFLLVGGTVYLGHRFIYMPAQRVTKSIADSQAQAAQSNKDAADAHKAAAEANKAAAEFNATTSEANARTAGHLERLTEMLLEAAVSKMK